MLQTAISLKETGHHPHVVSDAVSSRRTVDKETALERLRDNAVDLVTTEMVIFDWLARGDDEAFGDLLPIMKVEAMDRVARSAACLSSDLSAIATNERNDFQSRSFADPPQREGDVEDMTFGLARPTAVRHLLPCR